MATLTKYLLSLLIACSLIGPADALAGGLIPSPNVSGAPYVTVQGQAASCTTTSTATTVSQGSDPSCTINSLANRFVKDAFYLMGAVAVIMLIYAGMLYIQSNGNLEAMKSARQNIINVVLGIVLLITSYTIIALLSGAVKFFSP